MPRSALWKGRGWRYGPPCACFLGSDNSRILADGSFPLPDPPCQHPQAVEGDGSSQDLDGKNEQPFSAEGISGHEKAQHVPMSQAWGVQHMEGLFYKGVYWSHVQVSRHQE